MIGLQRFSIGFGNRGQLAFDRIVSSLHVGDFESETGATSGRLLVFARICSTPEFLDFSFFWTMTMVNLLVMHKHSALVSNQQIDPPVHIHMSSGLILKRRSFMPDDLDDLPRGFQLDRNVEFRRDLRRGRRYRGKMLKQMLPTPWGWRGGCRSH